MELAFPGLDVRFPRGQLLDRFSLLIQFEVLRRGPRLPQPDFPARRARAVVVSAAEVVSPAVTNRRWASVKWARASVSSPHCSRAVARPARARAWKRLVPPWVGGGEEG
ncbi:hypothetical protein TN53_12355 [Streptomyces sp. WM6386]|nr:hypothetical protein TN53_12355 [Streptomyces sp. WM6386]